MSPKAILYNTRLTLHVQCMHRRLTSRLKTNVAIFLTFVATFKHCTTNSNFNIVSFDANGSLGFYVLSDCVSERVSSFLTAHQHNVGYNSAMLKDLCSLIIYNAFRQ